MKNLIYRTIFIITSSLLFSSCLFQEDDIFDDSAANRMTKTLAEYNDILLNAPNGWLVEYYAEKPAQKMGGYNFIWNFEKGGNVKVAIDSKINDIEIGEQIASGYSLIADQGPVLTFDTYNKLVHYFCNPSSADLDGYAGDFEFVMQEVSVDKIKLIGKRNRNTITMTALAKDVDQADYLKKTNNLYFETMSPQYKIFMNNTEIGYVSQNIYKFYTFTYTSPDEKNTKSENVVFTTEGFKFYSSVTINGTTVSNFKWDAVAQEFKCADGPDIRLVPNMPENYTIYANYLGSYNYTYGSPATTIPVEIKENIPNQSYYISGLFSQDVLINYNFSTGIMGISMQNFANLDPNTGYIIRLYCWDSVNGYLATTTSPAGIFIKDPSYTSGIRYKMEDNKLWGSYKVDALYLRLLDGSGANMGVPSGRNRTAGPVYLTKK